MFKVIIWNDNTDDMVETWECQRHMTNKDFREILRRMFKEVCWEGVDASHLTADIYFGMSDPVQIRSRVTYGLESEIYCNFEYLKQRFRQMEVAS